MPPSKVQVVEVAPRDGLQNEDRILPTSTKVRLVERLVAAGLRRVEVASFVHPRLVPAMADAEDVAAGVDRIPDRAAWSAIGLVLNERGLARAIGTSVDEVNVVAAASDGFARRNNGCDALETIARAAAVVQAARAAGRTTTVTLSTAFGCPYDGEVDPGHVEAMLERLAEAEPDEIAIADTIGVGVPRQVTDLVARARRAAPGVRLRAHFHNTRNTGYANAFAAVEAGVDVLDASAGGIGGCPFAPAATGNIATEDLCFALERSGVSTGVDVDAVAAVGTWVARELGHQRAPGLLGRAGVFPPHPAGDVSGDGSVG